MLACISRQDMLWSRIPGQGHHAGVCTAAAMHAMRCTCKYTCSRLQHMAQGQRELALLVLTENTNQ